MTTNAIVDTHVHLWDPGKLRYHWLDGIQLLNKPYLPADYRQACGAVKVEKLVFVQCDCLPTQALAEVEFVEHLAERDARIAGIVAYAPVERGQGARDELSQFARHPLVKGVRRLLQGEADNAFCLKPGFLEGVAQLSGFGLSFDICIKHDQLASATEMVRQTPQVQFILDHIAKPDIKAQRFDPWRQELKALSQLPNVCCKLSGLVTEADHARWQPEELKPYIDHVLACFGPDRVLFGSDWPVVLLAASWQRWVEVFDDALSTCSASEKEHIFRQNALTIYRLN